MSEVASHRFSAELARLGHENWIEDASRGRMPRSVSVPMPPHHEDCRARRPWASLAFCVYRRPRTGGGGLLAGPPPLPLSASPPLRLSTSPPLHLSASPPLHLSTSPPLHLSTSPPLHLSTSPPLTVTAIAWCRG